MQESGSRVSPRVFVLCTVPSTQVIGSRRYRRVTEFSEIQIFFSTHYVVQIYERDQIYTYEIILCQRL